MLATLAHEPFSDEGWIYERKLDGERCLGFCARQAARLQSRSGRSLDDTYPEIRDELAARIVPDCIVDGEVVAFEGNRTSFARLQGRMQVSDPEEARRSSIAVFYYLFDLLYVDGHDITAIPLRDRKRLLRRALDPGDHIRFCAHRNREGEAYHESACRRGWEGLIAKDAASDYVHSRSRSWLKLKCVDRQELVIGGYTDPEGSRIGFGALLLGYYDEGRLVYAGKVGTGFDDDTLRRLGDRLAGIERKTSPYGETDVDAEDVHWVTPELVAEIGFTEWTEMGRQRHPRFLGLRRDKDPEDVHREVPQA